MIGFGADTLTEQYQPPVQARCVINDPPPRAVVSSTGLPSGIQRTFALDVTLVETLDAGIKAQVLGSVYKSATDNVMIFLGPFSQGFTDETISVGVLTGNVVHSFAVAAVVPAGQHTIVGISSAEGGIQEIWVDAIQQTIQNGGNAPGTPLAASYPVVGARAASGGSSPDIQFVADQRVHRFDIDEGAWSPEDIATFAAGGSPSVGAIFRFPCSTS